MTLDIILLSKLIKHRVHFTIIFYMIWLSIQIYCIASLVLINGDFDYFNPILGTVNIEQAIMFFSTAIVIIKALILVLYRKRSIAYHEQVEFCCETLKNFPLLRWIGVSIWQVYILDIYLGHGLLSLPISLLLVNFGAMVFVVPFLSKSYRNFFWVSLLAVLPLALASGARGPLLFPIVFYLIGVVVGKNFDLRLIIKLSILSIPILIGSSILGVARYAARYGADQTYLGLMSNMFVAATDIITQNTNILLFGLNTLSDRLVQWPVLIAIQTQLKGGIEVPFSWIDEFIFSFRVSGTTNGAFELQEKILESGMLYGLVDFLGYEPSVGWTVPVNIFVEFTMRFGLLGSILSLLLPVILMTFLYRYKKSKISLIIMVNLPGLLLFRIPETHSVYLVKQLFYMVILICILICVDRFLPKKVKTREA